MLSELLNENNPRDETYFDNVTRLDQVLSILENTYRDMHKYSADEILYRTLAINKLRGVIKIGNWMYLFGDHIEFFDVPFVIHKSLIELGIIFGLAFHIGGNLTHNDYLMLFQRIANSDSQSTRWVERNALYDKIVQEWIELRAKGDQRSIPKIAEILLNKYNPEIVKIREEKIESLKKEGKYPEKYDKKRYSDLDIDKVIKRLRAAKKRHNLPSAGA
jgi:hypothetical protein